MKVFKYVWQHKILMIIIAVMMVGIQMLNFCVPSIMSSVIDTGITHHGIISAAPERISKNKLIWIEDINPNQVIFDSYVLDSDGCYDLKKDEIDNDILNKQIAGPFAFISSEDFKKNNINSTGQLNDFAKKNYEKFLTDNNEKILNQKALNASYEEMKSLGVDVQKIQMDYLFARGGLMLGVSIAMIFLSYICGCVTAYLTSKISKNMRRDFFAKIMFFSQAEINRFSESSLITRATNDISFIQGMAGMIISTVVNAPICIIAGFYFAWMTAPMLSWMIGITAVAILVGAGIMVNWCKPVFIRMQMLFDMVNLRTREMLSGIYVSRAFNRAEFDKKKFNSASEPLYKNQLFMGRLMAVLTPLIGLGTSGITVLVYLFGGFFVSEGSGLQVGDLMAFTSYAAIVTAAFTSLGMFIGSIPRATVAINRVEEVLYANISIKYDYDEDFPQFTKSEEEDSENALSNTELSKNSITFKNVSFSYNNAKTRAVKELNFTIEPGTTFGIIGTVGSGKTTILKLLMHMQNCTEGEILIGDTNIKDVSLKAYRELFSFCPQQSFLFSGTVETNVGYDVSRSEINDFEDYLIEHIKTAQAGDFVLNDEGIARKISQDSTNISGGQRQRLSIARGLASNNPILVLDDCFSALDYRVEKNLRESLEKQSKNKTKVIVSSRLSSVKAADQILVLDEGRMVGLGSHRHLMKTCPEYIKIAKSQLDKTGVDVEDGVADA